MITKKIGPNGQIIIPSSIRESLGLQPGAEVTIEVRGNEVVISRPKINGSYTDYYLTTSSPKLKTSIDEKKLIHEETEEKHGIPRL